MTLRNVKYYVKRLISDGHSWQKIDVNGKELKLKYYFSGLQFFFLVLAVISLFLNENGFNLDFAGYVLASLSLFVGLFLTLILTVYDKFLQTNFEEENMSKRKTTFLIQKKNFFKQFIALTSYAILLSIFCIGLISLTFFNSEFQLNFFDFELISSLDSLNFSTITNFFWILVIALQRFLIVYFFLDFLLMVLYALTSMYHFISIDLDSISLKQD